MKKFVLICIVIIFILSFGKEHKGNGLDDSIAEIDTIKNPIMSLSLKEIK